MSVGEFEAKQERYIASVATAVRVPLASVSVAEVRPVSSRREGGAAEEGRAEGGGPEEWRATAAAHPAHLRRVLLSTAVEVRTLIKGARPATVISKSALDTELERAGLPASQALKVEGLKLGGVSGFRV